METIFNFFVTSDWLLFSGTFIFLFLGYLFGKIFLLYKEDEAYEKGRKQLQSEKALAAANDEKKIQKEQQAAEFENRQQQQQQQQKQPEPEPEKSAKAEPPTLASLISLQLKIDDDSRRTSDAAHFFTSHIPLGPQVEQRAAAIDVRTLRKKFAELKMVIVMRRDLKPTESLAAGWGSTVALENVQHVRAACAEPWLSWLRAWNAMAVAKVAVRVDSMEAMRDVIAAAVDVNVRHKALVAAAKARRDRREVAKKEKEEEKFKKQQQDEGSKSNGNDDDADEDGSSKRKSEKEIEDNTKKKKSSSKKKGGDDDDDDDEEEEDSPVIPDVSELFSLPISGLIMSEKPKPDDANVKKKSSSSSKGPSPQPKNKPLDISKMDFTVASSEELLKILEQIMMGGGESAFASSSIPCVAIGPCPVEFFEGVTDSLKLY